MTCVIILYKIKCSNFLLFRMKFLLSVELLGVNQIGLFVIESLQMKRILQLQVVTIYLLVGSQCIIIIIKCYSTNKHLFSHCITYLPVILPTYLLKMSRITLFIFSTIVRNSLQSMQLACFLCNASCVLHPFKLSSCYN